MFLDFYGLKENPFNVTADPNFLFLSIVHKEALSHLLYGIREKKGFLEITGEVGTGKTTLCKALLNQLDSKTRTAFILNSNLPELQLLEAIVEDFGIRPARKNKISLMRQLNRFLLDEVRDGYNVVLILDEAQNLKISTLEEIRSLSNLETDKQKLFQIVLVGQPQLRDKLNSRALVQLRQRIAIRFHINPLERDEVDDYIYHRIGVAGAAVNTIWFTPDALDEIFYYSRGIPRLINLVCDRALLLGYILETKTVDIKNIKKSISEIEGNVVEIHS